ncbi:hypothetical protein ElyMa_002197500, partial [Elysia marginata]
DQGSGEMLLSQPTSAEQGLGVLGSDQHHRHMEADSETAAALQGLHNNPM